MQPWGQSNFLKPCLCYVLYTCRSGKHLRTGRSGVRSHRVRDNAPHISRGVALRWIEFPLPGLGALRLSHDHLTISAHCGRDGHDDEEQNPCRLYRSAAKRPLGFLVSWLFVAQHHSNRKSHNLARLKVFSGDKDPRPFPKRKAAREWLHSRVESLHLQALFVAEGNFGRTEPRICP